MCDDGLIGLPCYGEWLRYGNLHTIGMVVLVFAFIGLLVGGAGTAGLYFVLMPIRIKLVGKKARTSRWPYVIVWIVAGLVPVGSLLVAAVLHGLQWVEDHPLSYELGGLGLLVGLVLGGWWLLHGRKARPPQTQTLVGLPPGMPSPVRYDDEFGVPASPGPFTSYQVPVGPGAQVDGRVLGDDGYWRPASPTTAPTWEVPDYWSKHDPATGAAWSEER